MTAGADDELYLLAGEYVLGLAPAVPVIEERLARKRDLRVAVGYWERRLIGFAGAATPIAPGPALWARIAASIAPRAAPAARGRDAPRVSFIERIAVWRALAVAGLAAAAIAVFVALDPGRAGPGYAVVLQATADRSVGWIGQADAHGGVLFVPVSRAEIPADRALELWAKADDPKGPTSLGVVPADRSFRLSAGKVPPLEPGQLFAISLEPAGGSPLGRPTGPVLFAGHVVAAR
jgi:anti-sigma-K factor RskA